MFFWNRKAEEGNFEEIVEIFEEILKKRRRTMDEEKKYTKIMGEEENVKISKIEEYKLKSDIILLTASRSQNL